MESSSFTATLAARRAALGSPQISGVRSRETPSSRTLTPFSMRSWQRSQMNPATRCGWLGEIRRETSARGSICPVLDNASTDLSGGRTLTCPVGRRPAFLRSHLCEQFDAGHLAPAGINVGDLRHWDAQLVGNGLSLFITVKPVRWIERLPPVRQEAGELFEVTGSAFPEESLVMTRRSIA
jgi:hypothetical protein